MVEKYRLYSGTLFITLWTMICYGFVVNLVPPLEVIRSALFMLFDAVFIILGLGVLRDRRDITVVVSFVIIVIISGYINHQSLVYMLNGSRDYIGLMFSVPIIRYLLNSKNARRFADSFDRQLMFFLYLQAPLLLYQFLRYGACDWGGGSFGYGGSDVVSILIYIVSFYLLCKKWNFDEGWWVNLRRNKIYFLLLIPTFLNETKVSFIFVVAYFMLLFPLDRRYFLRALMVSPFVALIVAAGYIVYSNTAGKQFESIFTYENLNNYLAGGEDPEQLIEVAVRAEYEGWYDGDNVFEIDLPRFTKLALVPEALSHTAGGMWWGAGVGQFKNDGVIAATAFQRYNKWALKGTTTALFRMVIDLGIMGVIWMTYALLTLLFVTDHRLMGKNIKVLMSITWTIVMLYDYLIMLNISMFIMAYVLMDGMLPPKEESTGRWSESNSD